MSKKIDWKNIRLGLLSVVAASIVAYLGQPFIHENDQAISVIVTVFSVLAGFLVAIIAIVGDPVLLPPGTWRAAEMERDKLLARLVRHKWLFYIYLITLALIFLSLLIKDVYIQVSICLERVYLFFSVFAFSLSLRLPAVLMSAQQERIDAVIEYRRNEREPDS